jgi:RNA-binding protein 25
LFAFSVNWQLIDYDGIVVKHLQPWIVQKVIELLGEEEQSLTEFVVTTLKSHCSPAELQSELSLVLDADSETFVLKLWKILVFYSIHCEVQREYK